MTRIVRENGSDREMTLEEETARNAEEQAWADSETTRNALAEIQRLESAISSRRYREAIAGSDGGWLANQESLIAAERGKL
jgi:hypothetical protein